MNLRVVQKSEPSCAATLVIGAMRHTSRRDAQLTETSSNLLTQLAQRAASPG
ncbi:hypothetical protein A2U01_0085790, partial [Trifolium medium]|nr:hypothetical protein [Trifolium medium]